MSEDGALRIENLLQEVVRLDASDLHIQVGLPPIVRQSDALIKVEPNRPLKGNETQALVFSVLDDEQKALLLKNKEVDCGFTFGNLGRFRVNAFHERGNLAMSLRLIPSRIKSLEELQLPAVVATFAEYSQGLVLCTGPTGSGKSSSLAALVDLINREKKRRIITIEDPIEFIHISNQSVVVQREVHYDTFSFAAALRSALRQDPDIVLVGELRDLETIASALTLAETGHLVFATLHTNSAPETINRLIDVFPAEQQAQIRVQLSTVLKAVCAQRLLPAIAGGRVVATEILIADSGIKNLIREAKIHQIDSVIQNSAAAGMQTMDQNLLDLVRKGLVTFEDAIRIAQHQDIFQKHVQASNIG